MNFKGALSDIQVQYSVRAGEKPPSNTNNNAGTVKLGKDLHERTT